MGNLRRDILLTVLWCLMAIGITGCGQKPTDNEVKTSQKTSQKIRENKKIEVSQETEVVGKDLVEKKLDKEVNLSEGVNNIQVNNRKALNEIGIELGDKVYYTNIIDHSQIYMLDKKSNEVSLWLEQSGSWFNYQDGKIFFLSIEDKKVYCYDQYSKELLGIYEDENPIKSYLLQGDKIYYSTGMGLYRMSLNYEDRELLRVGKVTNLIEVDKKLYYIESGNVYNGDHELCFQSDKDIVEFAFYRGKFYMSTMVSLIVTNNEFQELESYEDVYIMQMSFYEDRIYSRLSDGIFADIEVRKLDNLNEVVDGKDGYLMGECFLILKSGELFFYQSNSTTRYRLLDYKTKAVVELSEEEFNIKVETAETQLEESAFINDKLEELKKVLEDKKKHYYVMETYNNKLYYNQLGGLYESDGDQVRLLTFVREDYDFGQILIRDNKLYYWRDEVITAIDLETYIEEAIVEVKDSYIHDRILYIDDNYGYYLKLGDSVYVHYLIYRIGLSDKVQEELLEFRGGDNEDKYNMVDHIFFKDDMNRVTLKITEGDQEVILDREPWSK